MDCKENEASQVEKCMDWSSSIEDDGRTQKLTILPEGDYEYYVKDFKKDYYGGSSKISPCNMAILTLRVKDQNGTEVNVRTNLLLHRTLEWKLSSFFRSIGMKKHGQALKPDWDHIVGAAGRAHFKPCSFVGKDGAEKKANSLCYFIDKSEEVADQFDEFIVGKDDDDEFFF